MKDGRLHPCYCYCEENNIDAYLKYNTFHKEKESKYKNDISKKENIKYDASADEYAGGRKLKFKEERSKTTDNGFQYTIRRYECVNCEFGLISMAHSFKKLFNKLLKAIKNQFLQIFIIP